MLFSYTAELLELSGNAARDNRRTRISPRHTLLAIASDEELSKVIEEEKKNDNNVKHMLSMLICFSYFVVV